MLYLLLIHKKKIGTTTTPTVFIGSALLSARERDYGTMYLFPFEECSPTCEL
jgi:hypothetical protein